VTAHLVVQLRCAAKAIVADSRFASTIDHADSLWSRPNGGAQQPHADGVSDPRHERERLAAKASATARTSRRSMAARMDDPADTLAILVIGSTSIYVTMIY